MNDESKLNLTASDISDLYGISKEFLKMRRRNGDGPPWKKISGAIGKRGGRVVYPMKEFEVWLSTRPGGGERTVQE